MWGKSHSENVSDRSLAGWMAGWLAGSIETITWRLFKSARRRIGRGHSIFHSLFSSFPNNIFEKGEGKKMGHAKSFSPACLR